VGVASPRRPPSSNGPAMACLVRQHYGITFYPDVNATGWLASGVRPGTGKGLILSGDPHVGMKCDLHQLIGLTARTIVPKITRHCGSILGRRRRSSARRAIFTIAVSRLCERWLRLPGRMRRCSTTSEIMPKIRPAARARSYQSIA
jgi:hypothetical protein